MYFTPQTLYDSKLQTTYKLVPTLKLSWLIGVNTNWCSQTGTANDPTWNCI